jgi:hypothetical protein
MPKHAFQRRDTGRGMPQIAALGQQGIQHQPVRIGHVVG